MGLAMIMDGADTKSQKATHRSSYNSTDPMDVDPSSAGPDAQAEVQALKWKPGLELPPFVAANHEAVQLVLNLANGAVDQVPSIGQVPSNPSRSAPKARLGGASPKARLGLGGGGLWLVLKNAHRT